jgi:L-cysteine/cystine lyase
VSLRAEFPICSRLAYLNAGTDGPVPAAAHAAAVAALDQQLEEGRFFPFFRARIDQQAELRAGYARLLGCEPGDIALTTSTSEGVAKVLGGMGLGPGDEIVTAEDEHPGLIGPLIAARERGVTIRRAPLTTITDAVSDKTTVVACSHVSWMTGELADPALAEVGVPVVLDGAQGAGAVPVDPVALNCAAYAAAGQKWLCGADGTGLLYVAPAFRERVRAEGPGYLAFESADAGLDSVLHPDARRHDTPALSLETVAFTLAALGVFEREGWEAVHATAIAQAQRLADALAERGRTVAPRGATTLVSFEDPTPEATRERLAEAGVMIRDLPGTPYLRVSVGAWNDGEDLDRLLDGL